MTSTQPSSVSEQNLKELKTRLKLISDADPEQYHNDHSVTRYLKAFKTVDAAFQVLTLLNKIWCMQFVLWCLISPFLKAILKTNKWKKEYNVAGLTEEHPTIKSNLALKKARVLRHRDMQGRPVIYIPAKNHSVNDREIDELTQFIVFCLVIWIPNDQLTQY